MFLIDNGDDPAAIGDIKAPYVVDYGPDLHLRRLYDGNQYRVVEGHVRARRAAVTPFRQGSTARLESTRWFIFAVVRLADGRRLTGRTCHRTPGRTIPRSTAAK